MKEAWELFLHGGFVMWPLLVALIIAVAIAIERIAYYRQLKREMFALNDALEESEINWQSLLTSLESKYTANISYNLPRVLEQCQDRNVLQSKMEDMVAHVYTHASRGLDWLSTIVTIAPLLGLLGTVTGMIGAFQVFGADGAVVVGLAVGDLHRGGGAHNNLSAVGSVDSGALVGVVHHVGGQGLERHLGGLLTGHGVGQHDALGGDARVHRVGGHVDGPVVAHIVSNLRVIAQGHQHHLRKGQAGQLALGVKVAVAGARQDALLHAVADVARRPAVGRHVLEGGGVGAQLIGVLLAQQHDSHDLGGLLTGQDAGGVEGALVGALEYTDGGHHINRLSVGDFSRVVEITAHSAGGDDHHAHNQGHGHYQAESPLEVSHLDFLLLNFEPEGRMTPLTKEK